MENKTAFMITALASSLRERQEGKNKQEGTETMFLGDLLYTDVDTLEDQ